MSRWSGRQDSNPNDPKSTVSLEVAVFCGVGLHNLYKTCYRTYYSSNGLDTPSVSLANYLVPRGKRGIIQLRVPVPRSIQDCYGKVERIKSMGTADRATAARRALPVLAEWQAEFAAHEAQASAGSKPWPALAVERAYHGLLERLEGQRRQVPDDVEAYAQHLEQREKELLKLTRRRQDGIDDHWQGIADRIIAAEGLKIAKGSEAYTSFVDAIADSTIDALSVFTRRATGELDAEPRTKTVKSALDSEADTAPAGETLMELFERYASQRLAEKRKRMDGVNQDRKKLALFADFIGSKRKVASVETRDVLEYRYTLEALPKKFRDSKAYRGLDMRAAAERARKLGAAPLAKTTVNSHLSALSGFFIWLREVGYTDTNPCEGVFYRLPKGQNPRPPFSTEQLNQMLQSALFTGFLADGKEHEQGNCRADDWRYWLPLVCMFTGARLGEIAQLHIGDVKQEHGVWFLHIRHDEAAELSTKSGHSRPMPVHSKLQALGFLEFVERQRARAAKDGNARLFPDLKPNARGQISGKPSRFWQDYLKRIGVKVGADGFGAHSFRHLISDQLRRADYLDNQIAVALGHSQKTTTSGYGQLKQGTVTMLRDMIEAVEFDGVDFDHLMPA